MSEIMVDILYPASDAVFYIETRTPTDSEEWSLLQARTLMIASQVEPSLQSPSLSKQITRCLCPARFAANAMPAATGRP